MNSLVQRGEWKIAVETPPMSDPLNRGIHLWIGNTEVQTGARLSVAQPMTFVALEEGMPPGDATLHLEQESARDLFFALYEAFRQTGVIPAFPDDAAVDATKAHLQDMRKLVFDRSE